MACLDVNTRLEKMKSVIKLRTFLGAKEFMYSKIIFPILPERAHLILRNHLTKKHGQG